MSLGYLNAVSCSRGLGNLFDDISAAVTGARSALQAGVIATAADVLADPALPEVIRTVGRLHATTATGGSSPKPGIGLSRVLPPLKLYVYASERAWVWPALVAGIIGIPFLLGRASKR